MLSHAEMSRVGVINMLNNLPRPTLCSQEQLALAVGYLFTLSDEELAERCHYVHRMTKFVTQSERSMKFLQLRNLKIYSDLLEQVITARVHGTLMREKELRLRSQGGD